MDLMSINYYYRHRLYGTVSRLTTTAATIDPVAALYKALSLSNLGHVSEALQILSTFLMQSDASIACIKASIYAHNSCQVVDREAVSNFEDMLRDKLKNNRSSRSLYLEALYLYLIGDNDNAISAAETSLKLEANSSKVLSLLGWLNLDLKKIRVAARYFVQALQDKENSDAGLGEIHCINPIDGLTKINKLVVRHPKEMVPIIHKMELLLNVRQWDTLADTILRASGIDSTNISVLQIQALKHIIDGKYEEAVPVLEKLYNELEKQESKAWWLFLDNISLFSRICGGNVKIYSCLEHYAKSALRVCTVKESPKVLLEVGHLYYLWAKQLYSQGENDNEIRERLKLAEGNLRRAANSDESTRSLVFLIMVELVYKNSIRKQIYDQLDLLSGLGADRDNPEFSLAKVLARAVTDHDTIVQILDKAVTAQQAKSSATKYGIPYLISLDPQFLVDIAAAYPKTKTGEKHRIRVLMLVVETIPGFINASLDLGRAHLAADQLDEALNIFEHVTSIDSNNPYAYLLQAQIHIMKGDFEKGRNILDIGLANNLQIMEFAKYHLLLANLAKFRNNYEMTINELKQAITMNKGKNGLTLEELSELYLDLSAAYMKTKKIKEATEAIKEARELLSGTDDTSVVTIAQARLSLTNGDIRGALSLLSSVPKGNPFYIQAQKEKADIYLNELQDGVGYSQCYQALVEADPTTENLTMLADAYMNIQESELAVQTYEKAMSTNADDNKLSCKLARVFVKCHQYSKAIKAYKNSGEDGSLELAELLLKLGQPDKAEQALTNLPLSRKAITLAKIYEKLNDFPKAVSTLREATSLQHSIDHEWSAKLYRQMAVYCTSQRDYKQAIDLYKKALHYTPNDSALHIALVKLYMQVDDWSNCEDACKAILSREPENEPALLTTADLALRRVDLPSAMKHFSSILDRRPDYWVALARLIEVCRRCDKLDSALPYLQMAKEKSGGHSSPGLSYCKGLYEWYRGDTQAAVASFNSARTDAEWGPQAVYNMIEISLSQNGTNGGATTAHRLLAELKPRGEDEENTIGLVEGFIRLATGDKSEIERAIIDFTSLANSDLLRVGASLGLAMGYVEQNQMSRAKAVLKRVAKLPWSLEEADYLERCWLMLAEIYINSGTQQAAQAQDLLNRVIVHNRSCIKAFTLLATLATKENNYQKAVEHYRQAWRLSGESDPSLGYKLGYTQLKNKQYADAISTCQRVLQLHPDYPKIRKEILDKALPRLRT
ncbi:hypothetical protein O3M35_003547 [Rhynocoris fuscipes]|uniref:Tetratricopeptide repeat protein 21B n=1 Tax=Rhynocoris fuscipes TaxID=488301 RepID=A0AAW1CKM5_9HEMI